MDIILQKWHPLIFYCSCILPLLKSLHVCHAESGKSENTSHLPGKIHADRPKTDSRNHNPLATRQHLYPGAFIHPFFRYQLFSIPIPFCKIAAQTYAFPTESKQAACAKGISWVGFPCRSWNSHRLKKAAGSNRTPDRNPPASVQVFLQDMAPHYYIKIFFRDIL